MKYLAVFLLVGLGLASAYTSDFDDEFAVEAQRSWITDQMKVALEKMVEGMDKLMEKGQEVSEEAFRKAEEMYHKLLDWGIDVGEKIKEALDRIGQHFDKIDQEDSPLAQDGPIINRLKESFEKIVNKMKERFDGGGGVDGGLMKKAKDIFEKLKNMRGTFSISEKIRNIFEDMKSKMGRSDVQRGPMIEKLKEAFEKAVNKMKEAFEGGQGVRGDLMKKAEDIYEKLKNLKVEISEKIRNIFEDLRSKMGRNSVQRGPMIDKMKEAFEKVVNRIKEAFEGGEGVRGDLMKKAEDIYEKLKNLKVEISDKIKNIFEDLRSKMGRSGPTSQDASIASIRDVFKKLKDLIKSKLDGERLKDKVEELFGKGSEIAEQIVEMLKSKGEKAKQKVLDWIDRVFPDKEERSVSELFDQLREFFKDLQLDLKERFSKFGNWIKEKYQVGLEKGKTRAENIKKIAKEFIDDTRDIGKDMAEEALGFFREYKHDLGKLYENVVDKIAKILKS